MKTKVKICGIKTPDAMTAALEGGADFVGLVFAPASPRYVDIEVAAYLANYVPEHVQIVGLFSDTPPDIMQTILSNVRIDLIQLHGAETPEECAAITTLYKRPVMKALSVRNDQVLKDASIFLPSCSWLLFDAPPPADAVITGGHGAPFDWSMLRHAELPVPWMLAGGLTPDTVAEAIRMVRPDAVDVSSGVESSRGVKDAGKIRAFLKAAQEA